jgi:hypothetical protein
MHRHKSGYQILKTITHQKICEKKHDGKRNENNRM